MNRSPDGKTLAAFVAAVLIGGANYIAVSFSNKELPPMFGATLRFALASVLFLLIARANRVPMAHGRAMAGGAAYGLLAVGVTYALLYYSLVVLAAGTVSVIVACAPLATLAIAVALGQERFSVRGLAGGLLAVSGIAVLSLGSFGGEISGFHLIAAIVATFAVGLSSVIARAMRDVHPLNINVMAMPAGTLLLAVASRALGESWALPRETGTLIAVTWLVTFGSVGLFQLFLYIVNRWTASATIYVAAGMPVVAVALGALLLDQPVTWEVVVGGLVVIAAVYVGAISGKRSSAPPEG